MFNRKRTLLLKNDLNGIKKAAEILNNHGIAAIPTETVYGLAANALSPIAIKKIFKAKGRPQDNPLIVHISDKSMLYPLVSEIPENANILMDKFWPGPLTLIFKKSGLVPNEVSGGLETVGVRMPSHKTALDIIKATGLPLAAPSANISGSPSPTSAHHCADDLNGKIDAVVDGGECAVGLESTVLDLTVSPPAILRPGGITYEQLREVISDVTISPAVTDKLNEDEAAPSPGMKYRHYSPKAKMVLVKGDTKAFCDYVNQQAETGVFALCFEEDEKSLAVPFICYGKSEASEQQAATLFSALRKFDENGAELVYVHSPDPRGLGLAVYNRLLRACAFEIKEI